MLMNVLDSLHAEGFNVASFSGGEPLLYKELFTVMRHARQLGMTVTATTNGMLLNTERAAQLAENAQLVAISVDGIPAITTTCARIPGPLKRWQKTWNICAR